MRYCSLLVVVVRHSVALTHGCIITLVVDRASSTLVAVSSSLLLVLLLLLLLTGMLKMGFDDERLVPIHNTAWWASKTVGVLSLKPPMMIGPDVTCQEAVDVLAAEGYDQLPVADDAGHVLVSSSSKFVFPCCFFYFVFYFFLLLLLLL